MKMMMIYLSYLSIISIMMMMIMIDGDDDDVHYDDDDDDVTQVPVDVDKPDTAYKWLCDDLWTSLLKASESWFVNVAGPAMDDLHKGDFYIMLSSSSSSIIIIHHHRHHHSSSS